MFGAAAIVVSCHSPTAEKADSATPSYSLVTVYGGPPTDGGSVDGGD
jgi:hypothetical protein